MNEKKKNMKNKIKTQQKEIILTNTSLIIIIY